LELLSSVAREFARGSGCTLPGYTVDIKLTHDWFSDFLLYLGFPGSDFPFTNQVLPRLNWL
jgi:hypothetical protein